MGRYEEARDLCTRAVAIRRRHGDESGAMGSLLNLALVEVGLDQLGAAERHSREALDWLEEHFPADHPRTARYLTTRGLILLRRGDLEGAGAVFRRSRSICERVFSPGHRQLAWLAVLEHDAGRHDADLTGAVGPIADLDVVPTGLPFLVHAVAPGLDVVRGRPHPFGY